MICENVNCENYDPRCKSHCSGESMKFVDECHNGFQIVQMLGNGCYVIALTQSMVDSSFSHGNGKKINKASIEGIT